jgi:hypothetical protein
MLEIFEDRHGARSVILTSQLRIRCTDPIWIPGP